MEFYWTLHHTEHGKGKHSFGEGNPQKVMWKPVEGQTGYILNVGTKNYKAQNYFFWWEESKIMSGCWNDPILKGTETSPDTL